MQKREMQSTVRFSARNFMRALRAWMNGLPRPRNARTYAISLQRLHSVNALLHFSVDQTIFHISAQMLNPVLRYRAQAKRRRGHELTYKIYTCAATIHVCYLYVRQTIFYGLKQLNALIFHAVFLFHAI